MFLDRFIQFLYWSKQEWKLLETDIKRSTSPYWLRLRTRWKTKNTQNNRFLQRVLLILLFVTFAKKLFSVPPFLFFSSLLGNSFDNPLAENLSHSRRLLSKLHLQKLTVSFIGGQLSLAIPLWGGVNVNEYWWWSFRHYQGRKRQVLIKVGTAVRTGGTLT